MALPRFECSAKFSQYRFYTIHEDDYSSTFFMFFDGDWGHIVGLNGFGFLKNIARFLPQIMDEAGIEYVSFTMLAPLLEKLALAIAPVAEVNERRKFISDNREFSFVEIRRKSAGTNLVKDRGD